MVTTTAPSAAPIGLRALLGRTLRGSEVDNALAALTAEETEAVEVGLLLAEVERRVPDGWGIGIQPPAKHQLDYEVGISPGTEWRHEGHSSTLCGALTNLLVVFEQLPKADAA